MTSPDHDELARNVEQRVGDAIRKTSAIATGATKGAASGVKDSVRLLPRWLKIITAIVVTWWFVFFVVLK